MPWYLVRLALLGVLRRGRRSLALVAAIGFAACSFTVLISNSRADQVELQGTATAGPRGAYDILVLPHGTSGETVPDTSLLSPDFTAGQGGGITLAQYHTIAGLPGVQVAAPVAMIGQVMQTVDVTIDITSLLTGAQRQLFVASVTRADDQGLSTVTSPDADFSYVTVNPLRLAGQPGVDGDVPAVTLEEDPSGGHPPVCVQPAPATPRAQAAAQLAHLGTCWSTAPGSTAPASAGAGEASAVALPRGHVGLVIPWTFPSVLAAIDPVAEARLAGLNDAVTEGSYLPESATTFGAGIPVLVANQDVDDDTDTVRIRQLSQAAAQAFAAGLDETPGQGLDRVLSSSGPVVSRRVITASDAYATLLAGELNHSISTVVNAYYSAGPVTYTSASHGTLQARSVPGAWSAATAEVPVGPDPAPDPPDASDTGMRPVTAHVAIGGPAPGGGPRLVAVGAFAQARPAAAMAGVVLPLGVYRVAQLFGANDASARALAGNQLLPDANPAGYLTAPPTLLTSLSYLPELTSPGAFSDGDGAAPITTIRVRVAGAGGGGELARVRIQAVADLIAQRTGLDVSVMSGVVPVTRQVALPAGAHGRPALLLTSTWVQPVVGVAVARALDEDGLALIGLVLVVCAMFVANTTLASLDTRHAELGLLYQSGWRRRRVGRLLLTEATGVALTAGLLAMAVALPAGAAFGLPVTAGESAWSVPVAVALALAATGIPVWRACRPARLRGESPRRTVRGMRLSSGGLGALAARNLLRTPARNALAFAGVTLAAGAVTWLGIVDVAFGGSLTGELFGQVLSLQPRAADVVAAVGVLVLLVGLMTDLARLAVTDRRAERALLRELGWDHRERNRLLIGEMMLIVVAGAGLGAGLAAAAVIAAASSAPWPLWPTAVGGAVLIVTVAGLAAALPVQLHRDPVIRAHR